MSERSEPHSKSDRSFRVGVGGMIQESHSFSPASSSLERFRSGLYLRGREVFDTLGSCRHEVAGGLSELREAAVPLFFAFAASSGRPLDDPTYCHLQAELLGAIRDAGPLDGLLLVTHGAMVTEADDDGTGRLYAAIRELVGPDLPIVATIDCHANVTQRMVDLTDAMVFYHTQPHVDHVETGALGARILTGILDGEPPAGEGVPLPADGAAGRERQHHRRGVRAGDARGGRRRGSGPASSPPVRARCSRGWIWPSTAAR